MFKVYGVISSASPLSVFIYRRAPPGKCRYKPLPVKIRGKKVPFIPRECNNILHPKKLFGLMFTL